MICDDIKIAVKHILDEYDDGVQRCCGSCNPSCDDLTRFICFGHTLSEIDAWIYSNSDLLQRAAKEAEDAMDADYEQYLLAKDAELKLDFAKSFCADCYKFSDMKHKALESAESIFEAVTTLTEEQKECIKSCNKFNESFNTKMTDESIPDFLFEMEVTE